MKLLGPIKNKDRKYRGKKRETRGENYKMKQEITELEAQTMCVKSLVKDLNGLREATHPRPLCLSLQEAVISLRTQQTEESVVGLSEVFSDPLSPCPAPPGVNASSSSDLTI